MALLPRRNSELRALEGRLTKGLAVTAAVATAAVIGGEAFRRYRGRLLQRHPDAAHARPDSPVEAIQVAGRASQDTVLVALAGYESASRREAAMFNLFAGFVGASLFARVSTLGIREGWWPFGNVSVGGRHIHHFVPGILIAFSTGAAAIVTESRSVETVLAIPFGVGAGLTFDEAALLLDLEDVYWRREGILSVQVSLAVASFLGAAVLAMRMLRRGETQAHEQGRIPA